MRILIYGGSFNPPHLGHIDALRSAADAVSPDRILVIPAGMPPHKELSEESPPPLQRLALARLAFQDVERSEISDLELRRDGKSYTLTTLREIAEENPGAELYFLLGTDMLLGIEKWYRFREVIALCVLVALSRDRGEDHLLEETASALRAQYDARVILVKKEPLPMSSTSLREELCLRKGRERLTDPVYGEIIRRRYYGAKPDLDWLREKAVALLKPSRVPHVLGCEREAVRLARRWGEDEGEASEAGILHDITKKLTPEEHLRIIEKYGIMMDAFERVEPKLYHARTGAWMARERFGVSEAVFHAIERHTTGCVDMSKLDMIVYLADFIEPTRDFPGLDSVRALADTDLEQAMIAALRLSLEEVRSRGAVPHPRSVSTLEWLEKRESIASTTEKASSV